MTTEDFPVRSMDHSEYTHLRSYAALSGAMDSFAHAVERAERQRPSWEKWFTMLGDMDILPLAAFLREHRQYADLPELHATYEAVTDFRGETPDLDPQQRYEILRDMAAVLPYGDTCQNHHKRKPCPKHADRLEGLQEEPACPDCLSPNGVLYRAEVNGGVNARYFCPGCGDRWTGWYSVDGPFMF